MLEKHIEEIVDKKYKLLTLSRTNLINKYGDYFHKEAALHFGHLEKLCIKFNISLERILKEYNDYLLQLNSMHKKYLKTLVYPITTKEESNKQAKKINFYRNYPFILILSNVFSVHRFEIYKYFRKIVSNYTKVTDKCLEIGTGSGIDTHFMAEKMIVDTYDINSYSKKCLELFETNERINFTESIYNFGDKEKYNFVVLNEILEHVEKPMEYLNGTRFVLAKNGHAFLTFAIRAPQIDHIYHYRNKEEALEQINRAGLSVCDDFIAINTLFPFKEEDRMVLAENKKLPIYYCCLVN